MPHSNYVKLPASLISIGAYAFSGCNALEEIKFPDCVEKIGGHAFYNCTNLVRANIPLDWTTVTPYGYNLYNNPYYESPFVGCTKLNELTVPTGVTAIPAYAFWGANGLSKITLPDT